MVVAARLACGTDNPYREPHHDPPDHEPAPAAILVTQQQRPPSDVGEPDAAGARDLARVQGPDQQEPAETTDDADEGERAHGATPGSEMIDKISAWSSAVSARDKNAPALCVVKKPGPIPRWPLNPSAP